MAFGGAVGGLCMNLDSVIPLGHAIAYLAVLTIGLDLGVCLLLWTQSRRELWKQTRRVQLSSYLVPPVDAHPIKLLWLKCGKSDRAILEDILVDQCRLALH